MLVFAVNPARVRIDVVSSFGVMAFTLTSNGERFQLYSLSERQLMEGAASPCNLARLTQIPMPGHVLVSLMRGEAPLLEHEEAGAKLRWDDGAYVIDVVGLHQAKQTLRFEVADEDWDKPYGAQRIRLTGNAHRPARCGSL